MGLITSIAEKAAVSAATTAFPPLGWALKAVGAIETALVWWFGNAVRALITVIVIVILLAWHVIETKNATIARLTSEAAQMRTALDTDATSIKDQQVAIAKQDLAVMQLRKDSDAAVTAGDKADDAAVDRSKVRSAQASAIVVPQTGPSQAECRTPASVMAAKDSL